MSYQINPETKLTIKVERRNLKSLTITYKVIIRVFNKQFLSLLNLNLNYVKMLNL